MTTPRYATASRPILVRRWLRVAVRAMPGGAALLLSGCVFITGTLNPFGGRPKALEEHVVSGEGRSKILLVDISRDISDAEDAGPLGIGKREGLTARIEEELQQARRDENVCGVVLRINSRGGTVTASDVIYQEIARFKAERGIPVVAQLLDLGTSGAYYVALAADEIVASPTTVTGSIGVVMHDLNLTGLMGKIGVADQTIKAGEHKDIGSPLRAMTPEERRILQSVLDDMDARFLSLVRQRRPGMSEESVRSIADGRIVTANQALQAGLVDRISYLDDTVAALRRRAGVRSARVIMYRRPDEYAENIYSRAPSGPPQMNLLNLDLSGFRSPGPEFLYMWLPTP